LIFAPAEREAVLDMLQIDYGLQPLHLRKKIGRLWQCRGEIAAIEKRRDLSKGSRCSRCAVDYTARGWTEWTQGFQYGSAILQFDATGEERFLRIGVTGRCDSWPRTSRIPACTTTGSINVSTYGNF